MIGLLSTSKTLPIGPTYWTTWWSIRESATPKLVQILGPAQFNTCGKTVKVSRWKTESVLWKFVAIFANVYLKRSLFWQVPTSIPAPDYIAHLFEWISQCGANLTLSLSRKIFTRMFRVFVHVYYDHFETLRHLDAERHTSSFLLHFYFFVTEFDLVAKSQFEPLQILIDKLCEDLWRNCVERNTLFHALFLILCYNILEE